MHFLEALRISLQSLWANKLRSSLTLLGVVIGVAAVIAVVTFVNGINGYVAEKIFNLGADVFIISKVTPVITDVDQLLEGQKRKDLTMEDYHAVLEACRHCVMLGASTFNPNGHVKYNEQSVSDSWIRGLTPAMAQILDLDLAAGRMLNDNDENNRSNVTVIGTDIADNLFPGTDPLNKEIRVEGQIYRIVGIGKKQGKTLGARRQDVMMQFLIESGTMALVGGLLGVLFGITVAKGITAIIGMPSAIKLWAVAAGLIVSASVGVFFGVYPARRAARLDPIAALRFEM